ncbi:MAG: hypothetical protein KC636_07145 [Myxococcales bacterium]|nr:hypothetical protein [Myxococcales bacterium]
MATGERSPEDFDDELEASADEAAAHVEPHNDPKFDSADEDDSNVDATELDVSVDAWTHTESDDDDAEEAESVELAIDEEDDGHPAEGHPIERWVEDGGERGDELAVDEEDDDEGFTITVDPLSGRVDMVGELLDQHDRWAFLPDEGPDLD